MPALGVPPVCHRVPLGLLYWVFDGTPLALPEVEHAASTADTGPVKVVPGSVTAVRRINRVACLSIVNLQSKQAAAVFLYKVSNM